MPPRLNKRQQRELEELEALKALQQDTNKDDNGEDEDEQEQQQAVVSTNKRPVAGFAALSVTLDSDKSDEEGDLDDKPAQKKGKKKKKKPSSGATAPAPVPTKKQEPVPSTSLSKKADKKAKARQKKAEQDSFDSALKEMSQKYPELQSISTQAPGSSASSSQSASLDTFARLLIVSLTHLDPDAELRKFFGSKVLNAHKSDSGSASTGGGGAGGGSGGGKRRMKMTAGVRSHLTNPPKEWGAARQPREGLACRPLSDQEVVDRRERHGWNSAELESDKEKWWTVECNKRYKRLTKRFMQIVASGDPNAFLNLLYSFPWHIPTLLQQSEIARHREEHSTASELLSRALFSFELPLQTSPWSWTSGWNRLDFDDVENRGMYLAVHRNIMDLTRRGLLRTAFEFARLMYSMDPWEDPQGALLWLDWLSLRSGMSQWLLDIIQVWEHLGSSIKDDTKKVNPGCLPGWMYSRALAVKMLEDDKASTSSDTSSEELLRQAIINFPQVVVLLADKADINIDGQVRSRKEFKMATDAMGLDQCDAVAHLLSHLYVHRAHALYKDPKISSWFASVVNSLPPSSSSPSSRTHQESFNKIYSQESNVTDSVYRHVITVHASVPSPQHRSLLAFLPLQTSSVLSNSLQCDPAPPSTRLSSYDNTYFEDLGAEYGMSREDQRAHVRHVGRMLERMVADPVMREQLQPLFAARPDLVELLEAVRGAGGGGNVEDAVEVLNDVLFEAAQAEAGLGMDFMGPAQGPDGAGQRGMPGAFGIEQVGEDEVLEEDDDDEDDEGEGDDLPTPFRALRNILGRFWNPGGPPPPDSDNDEGEEHENGA